MPMISLACYSIRVRKRYARGENELLGGLSDGAVSFRAVCTRFLGQLHRQHRVDENLQSVQRASKVEHDDAGNIWGLVQAGDYGWQADFVDSSTFRRRFTRTPQDAELLPLYFRLHIRDDRSVGILVLQRFGHYGVYSALAGALREYVRETLPDYHVDLRPVVPRAVLDEVIGKDLTKIKITTYRPPADYFDKFKLGSNVRRETSSMVVEFHAKRGGVLPEPNWLRRLRLGQTSIIEFPEEFDPTRTRVQVQYTYKGKARLVDVSRLTQLAPYFDVSDQVTLTPGGHPTFTTIDSAAQDLVAELANQLGIA